MSGLSGVKLGTPSKNRVGKKYLSHDYTPVGGERPDTLIFMNKHSKIITAVAHCQSCTGLVESMWKTIIRKI
jgi:hypothetical protein